MIENMNDDDEASKLFEKLALMWSYGKFMSSANSASKDK